MRYRWPVAARKELVGERIKRIGILAEVRDIKDSLGVGQIKPCEIGIESGVGRAKVGNAG